MKIVHINYSFTTGGAEALLVDIVNEQAKTQDVSIIIINKLYNAELLNQIANKVPIFLLNRIPGSKNPFKIFSLWKLLLKLGPDIIHCHEHSIIRILFLFRAAKILTIHDVKYVSGNLYKYSKLIAISEAVRKEIRDKYQLDAKVIYNGINVENITYTQLIKKNNDNNFRIVQVSRLQHEKKGQHIVLEAVSRLIKNGINISVDFIGEGPSEEYLKQLTSGLNITGNVSFLGNKDRSYIYQHLCGYNLLIQPSLFEGFGITIIEAMAAGIEVLVSDIDGPREIIKKIGYGYKFKSGDSNDCALKIYEIYSNRSQSSSGLQREACKKLFDIKITAKNYLDEYRNLLSNK